MPDKDKRSAAALAAAEKLFVRNPDATPEEFRKACSEADKSVATLGGRQFHARYVLPTKRRLGGTKAAKSTRTAKKAGKKATKKTRSAKRGKATQRTKRPVHRAAGPERKRANARGRALARQLVIERDKQVREVLVSGSDPEAAYLLGLGIDEFIGELIAAIRSGGEEG
jgi:hypothetical protein